MYFKSRTASDSSKFLCVKNYTLAINLEFYNWSFKTALSFINALFCSFNESMIYEFSTSFWLYFCLMLLNSSNKLEYRCNSLASSFSAFANYTKLDSWLSMNMHDIGTMTDSSGIGYSPPLIPAAKSSSSSFFMQASSCSSAIWSSFWAKVC